MRCLDWLSLLVWGLVVLVGVLQSQRAAAGWLTNYGGDVFGPAALWWSWRRTLFAKPAFGAERAAITVWGACFAWEFCQLADFSGGVLQITQGTFDPLDLVAYSLTVAACYSVDKLLLWRQRIRARASS